MGASQPRASPGGTATVTHRGGELWRGRLQWLTICGPASYLTLLALAVLYYHPHPLPPVWPAFVILLALSLMGTFVFSRFVFVHVRRQEAEILHRSEELARVNEAMAVVKERQHIAREVHDSLAQSLGHLHLRLADVERRVRAGQTGGLDAELTALKQVAREAYEETRQAMFGLHSMVSRRLGFIPTLTEYLHDWSRRVTVAVDLRVEPSASITVVPAAEVQLIRIIQEALANVRKHARARHVVVRVEQRANALAVAIVDDGLGFDPFALEADRIFGLETMRERAAGIGGKLTLRSVPGHGTTVEVELPLLEPRR
jgi:signal transduction histidine kinase